MVPRDLRRFRRHMQMIFQDPYASLNARMTVGDALIESLMLHRELRRSEAKDAAASLLSQGRPHPRAPRALSRAPFRAGSASASRSRGRSPRSRGLSSPTSRSRRSTYRSRRRSLTSSRTCSASSACPSCSSATTSRWSRSWPIASWCSTSAGSWRPRRREALFGRPAHPYTAILMQAAPGAKRQGERLLATGEIPSPRNPPSGCVFRTRCPFAIAACGEGGRPALREIAPGHFKACIRDDIALSQ